MVARKLETEVLDMKARELAGEFLRPGRKGPTDKWIMGREFVMQELFAYTYKDVHEYILKAIRGQLGLDAIVEFDAECKAKLTPRDNGLFHQLLADNLAIDPAGHHIPGRVGKVEVDRRVVGIHRPRRGGTKPATWPIYAGEAEERAAGSDIVDELPPAGTEFYDNEHLRQA